MIRANEKNVEISVVWMVGGGVLAAGAVAFVLFKRRC